MAATILVIDDDPALVNLLKEYLESEGYQVLEGYDGQMALRMAQDSRPQLIVMDVNMPGVSGPEALAALRENDATRNIPIVLLTGDSARSANPAQDSAQKVTRLEKPVDFDTLIKLVHRLVGRP